MLTTSELLSRRARANLLHRPVHEPGPGGVTEVVRRTAGLQAQSWPGAVLAVRARSTATRAADVVRAREDDRSVLRGWFMRGTLQLVATEDAGWLTDLLAPGILAGSERRMRELELTSGDRERAVEVLVAELTAHGPRNRAEIAEALLRAELVPDPPGQTVYALIRYAGLRRVLCYGPDRGAAPTWVLARDWLPAGALDLDPDRSPAEQAAELARRYLTAYGPASVKDFVTWSGLPAATARRGFADLGDAVREVELPPTEEPAFPGDARVHAPPDGPLAELADATAGEEPAGVRLVGEFDPYLLGYRNRDLVVDPPNRRRIHPGGGMISPAVLRDGRAIGTWRPGARDRAIELFDEISDEPRAELDAELADLDRFHALAEI